MNITLKKEATPQQTTIAPPKGAFDLSGDAFGRAEKIRRILIGMSLVTIIILTILVLMGISAATSSGNAEASIASAQANQQKALANLNSLDKAGPYPAEAIRNHITPRQEAFVAAVVGEYDYAGLVSAIQAAAPNGLAVDKIAFSSGGAASAQAPAAAPGASTDPAPAEAQPAPSSQTVTVSASGPFDSLQLFLDNISTIRGLATIEGDPKVNRSPDGSSTIEFSTALTEDALSKRAVLITKSDPQGQVTETSPGTDPQATEENPALTGGQQ